MDTHRGEMAAGNGQVKSNHKRRAYRRQIRDGIRSAALRAFTGARLLQREEFPSLAQAARACGSTPAYVAAALIIVKSESTEVRQAVLTGQLSLLEAARLVRESAELVAAYRAASQFDRMMLGRVIGASNLFEEAVSPAL
jgi:hypothetical protein